MWIDEVNSHGTIMSINIFKNIQYSKRNCAMPGIIFPAFTHFIVLFLLGTFMRIKLIYIYIKWTVFVNVTTKSAQHAHARMIAIIVEKSPNSSHMYDHGFMDNTNRQAVKNWLDSQTRDASLMSWRQPFCKSKAATRLNFRIYKMAASMT